MKYHPLLGLFFGSKLLQSGRSSTNNTHLPGKNVSFSYQHFRTSLRCKCFPDLRICQVPTQLNRQKLGLKGRSAIVGSPSIGSEDLYSWWTDSHGATFVRLTTPGNGWFPNFRKVWQCVTWELVLLRMMFEASMVGGTWCWCLPATR